MFKCIGIISILVYITSVSSVSSQDIQTTQVMPQDEWKSGWLSTMTQLDSMFQRERRHWKSMQKYQNEATQELILKDIDSLRVFMNDVNQHIDMCNKFVCPDTPDGRNASETLNLKVGALKEYFEQCMLQIKVNNNLLQKKLKNETLDFKVTEIYEMPLINYVPLIQ